MRSPTTWASTVRRPATTIVYDGGFVEVFNQGDNSYIHHNYADNTAGFMELGASGGGSARNVWVAYNVMVNTDSALCIDTSTIAVTDLKFDLNWFINTANTGIGYRVFNCTNDFSALQVRYNIFYSNLQIADSAPRRTYGQCLLHSEPDQRLRHRVCAGAWRADRQSVSVNVGAGDFHLQAGSPAIDAGLNLGYTKDFENKTVPVGAAPDMGACEYGGYLLQTMTKALCAKTTIQAANHEDCTTGTGAF